MNELCRDRITWYRAGLESPFPQGYAGSNPARGGYFFREDYGTSIKDLYQEERLPTMNKQNKEVLKTKFSRICYNEGDNSIKKIVDAVKRAEQFNYRMFKIKPCEIQLNLVYSNKEYDKRTGLQKIENHYRGGYVDQNRIIIISPKIKKSDYSLYAWFLHEYNHIFYKEVVKIDGPAWFGEGMATYLMKEYKFDKVAWKRYFKKMKNPEKFLFFRYIKRRHYKHMNEMFILSTLVYEYLHKKFGQKRILSFIRTFARNPTKEDFSRKFIRSFKKTEKEIVRTVIN